jgi:hypothetical protein
MSADPSKVAHRFLHPGRAKLAGGVDFYQYARGSNARQAFRDAVDDARHEHGHGGYSGTLAEKSSYTMRKSTPMTRDDAYEFAYDDAGRNDKWGPAFAIPIAAERVLQEKEYTVKVKAKSRQDAQRLGKEAIASKGRTRKGVTISVKLSKIDQVAAGGVPPTETTKVSGTFFQVNGNGHYNGKRDAVAEVKKQIGSEWGGRPGSSYTITKVQQVAQIKVTGEAARLPTWEVTGTRKQVAMGKVEGYLFYGIASS